MLALRELKEQFFQVKTTQVSNSREFAQVLEQKNFNFVITDYQLRWTTGLDILRTIKKKYPDCPVVMFTGTGNEEIAVEAMKLGLDDYIIKSPKHYTRLAITVRSIWEREQERKARLELEKRYRLLFEGVPIGLYRLTPTGTVLEANSTLIKLLGYQDGQEELLRNQRIDFYVDPTIYLEWKAKLDTVGILKSDEVQLRRWNNELIWVRHSAQAIRSEWGELLYYEGVIEDITQQKQAEIERNQLLEREQEARAEAEAANRIKDEFLATLSHELRTPLNAILGWVQIINRPKIGPKQMARGLEIIKRNSKTQAQLIDDLLDVSRIIRGKLELQVAPIDLGKVINVALDTVSLSARAKRINLRFEKNSDLENIYGDFSRLQQVIWNLLVNAIKFTPIGGTVNINLEEIQSYAQIRVIDTGIGIEAKYIPYIFDRFNQVEGTSKRKYSGLGLGLAIVRYIVEGHGGEVFAESPGKGKGSTFTVKLPLPVTSDTSSKEQPFLLADPLNEFPDLSNLNILLVEDEDDSREFVTIVLEQCGATVTSTSGVREALEAFDHQPPDILISDIAMPEEDGYDLISKIRQRLGENEAKLQGNKTRLPFATVALTAYAQEEDKQKTLNAGFDLHLSKPIDPTEIAVAVAELVLLNRTN
ncbi:PAS sensor protein [Mastigocoleus testarum BC008]|uniref:histidine kinase n=2 Tax=Mastigocoleus TaxID=996924 RepID=A0A0V7ZLU3_9CYAN|nr:PAS sensor protein [Mastigocoleus testarum BC008]KST70493.1 PAS sensor protein [Mastigocoleus testarum BC008]